MSGMMMRVWLAFVRLTDVADRSEAGQSTAEYALVMIAAAAVAGLVLMWAHKTNLVGGLFDGVIKKVVGAIAG